MFWRTKEKEAAKTYGMRVIIPFSFNYVYHIYYYSY